MTDLLTKEERQTVERARLKIREDEAFDNPHTLESELLAIIDNLSKRGVKKYTVDELRNFAKESGISYQYFSAYFEGVTDFARFLGALEEK